MKKLWKSGLLALVLVSVLVLPAAAAPPTTDEGLVVEAFGSGFAPSDDANATLTRYTDKAHLTIRTDGLRAGDVYTVWAVTWNDPSACGEGGCGEPDVCTVPGSSVYWVTGKVINNNGTATFNAMIQEGAVGGDQGIKWNCAYPSEDPGLFDAENAEIHFVVRSHGQPIPGMVDEQKKSFNAGCDINVCGNHQAAIFIP